MQFLKGKNFQLSGNLIFLLIAQLTLFTIGILKVPIYSHVYPPEIFGQYTWCVALLSYIDILFLNWLNATVWRFVYNKNTYKNFSALLSSVLPIFFVVCALAFIVVLYFAVFTIKNESKSHLIIVGFLSITIQQLSSLVITYFQANRKIKHWSILIIAQQIITLALFFFFYYVVKQGIYSIFFAAISYNFIFLIFTIQQYFNQVKEFFLKFKIAYSKELIQYSFISILISICLMVLNNADRFVISYLKNESDLGIYAQYYGLASVGFYAAIQAFNSLYGPSYNYTLTSSSPKKIETLIFEAYILFFTPVSLFVILNAGTICKLLLAKEYEGHNSIFIFAVAGIYFYGLYTLLETRLKYKHNMSTVVVNLILVSIINIIANFILLRVYHFEISAIISVVSYLILLINLTIANRFFLKEIKLMPILKDLITATLIYLIFHFLITHFLIHLYPIWNITFELILFVIAYYFVFKKNSRKLLFQPDYL